MRLLFISNFYPPAHLGGKELRCQEVVRGLQKKGHTCLVLTSNFAPPEIALPDQPGVRRLLNLEADVYHYRPLDHFLHYPAQLRANLNAFEAALSEFEYDLVFIWGMWNLSPALAAAAEERMPNRVVYSFAGYWPIETDMHKQYWRSKNGNWLGRQFLRAMAPLVLSSRYRPVQARALRFAHTITCSQFVLRRLREDGLPLLNARVVLSGIDVNNFTPSSDTKPRSSNELKAVYAGGIASHKGVHTAIEAMQLLLEQGYRCISLQIIGQGHPDYRASLEKMITQAALEKWVRFRPAVPRGDMPRMLQQFGVLILPTTGEEPLSRVVMEAMACGLVVIATNTGGTPEMIDHGANGLLFDPGDSVQLANHLQTVVMDNELRERLSAAARRTAVAHFQISRMIDEIEDFLEEVVVGTQN